MAPRIRKGDSVIVISGKDKGKTGKVIASSSTDDCVVVEGINLVKRHCADAAQPVGRQIIERSSRSTPRR